MNNQQNHVDLDISVADNSYNYKWSLVCNRSGEVDGNHPQKEAICSALGRLQVPLDVAIKNAQPVGPCVSIYQPVNLIINGIVDGKETQVVENFSNSCILNRTLDAAGVPNLLPFNEDGSYNVDNN